MQWCLLGSQVTSIQENVQRRLDLTSARWFHFGGHQPCATARNRLRLVELRTEAATLSSGVFGATANKLIGHFGDGAVAASDFIQFRLRFGVSI